MNIELLRRVQERLRQEGREDMRYWVQKDPRTSCGTVGCIAGWCMIDQAVIDAEGKLDHTHPAVQAVTADELWNDKQEEKWQESVYQKFTGARPTANVLNGLNGLLLGQRLLGLTNDQAKTLFLPSMWPTKWRTRYENAPEGCARAKVVSDYIDYFIMMDGDVS